MSASFTHRLHHRGLGDLLYIYTVPVLNVSFFPLRFPTKTRALLLLSLLVLLVWTFVFLVIDLSLLLLGDIPFFLCNKRRPARYFLSTNNSQLKTCR
jgi:hypothetical protein